MNRVQADALSKHFFVGADLADGSDDPEFFWRNYVVDAPVNQSLIGVGSWSGIDRIRWEVTENLLIGRKAYQIAPGADKKGAAIKDPNGAIVAAYRITSHFDIRRAYNPTTGEEMNVVEENSADRPWYQREYMRVDWSSNQVQDPYWLDMFLGKLFGNITLTPLTYYENDPKSESAPHFEPDNGYFDVTNHYEVAPVGEAEEGATGRIPTCALVGLVTGSATYDCNAQEAIVRSSFSKIDPNDDFEPLENTSAPEDVLGNPGGLGNSLTAGLETPGIQGWDPGYGYVDKLYHRFAHIHNSWVASHQQNTQCAADGAADQCDNSVTGYTGSTGSQCDAFVGKCTLPYRDRQIKPIAYWVNKDMPENFQDPVDASTGQPTSRGAPEDLIYSWNQLMSNALGYAREVECRRMGDGDRAACHSQFFNDGKTMLSFGAWLVDSVKETTPALTICHNPVRAYDNHDACGATGDTARVGDVRKNFIFYWAHESKAPWGGIADWNADPLTGKIMGAAAAIMGRSVTYAAAIQRDTLQVAMGDIKPEDITDGTPADTYAHYLTNGESPAMSTEEIDRRVGSIDAARTMQIVNPVPLHGGSIAEKFSSFVDMQRTMSADITAQSTAQLEFDGVVKPLLGGKIEADMVDSHWMVNALGADPNTQITDQILNGASPLRGMDSGRMHMLQEQTEEALQLHGVCFLDHQAPAVPSVDMAGLAGYFKNKYAGLDSKARGEKIYQDLVMEAFKGIGIHEIGHSLGMFHEFASSWDAPNFNPQYWQLRTGEGAATKDCKGKPRTGNTDSCMGPRYLDPETDDELGMAAESRPGITYFANSSVMEYQIERFGETVGLGTYDEHVMNALYGRVLETIDDDAHGGISIKAQKNFAPRLETQLTEQDRMVRVHPQFGIGEWPTHYTEIARQMKVFDAARDCRDATDEEKAIGEWRIVHGKVCSPTPRDHAAWNDFLSDTVSNGRDAAYWHTSKTAKTGPDQVRWFYRWGQSRNSYLHVNPSDAGADPYEATINTIKRFDVSYPLSYFRRQNREWNYLTLPSRVADGYFERVRSYHWMVANSSAFYRSFGKPTYDAIAGDDNWHRPYLLAETKMFDFLARSILMPEPGGYSGATMPGQTRQIFDLPQQGSGQFNVGIIDGRFIGEDFDESAKAGGSWDYQHWMKHSGFSTEKTLAARALVDGRPTLFTISRENFLDGRGVKINFRSDLQPALDRLMGGILAEDWEAVGPYTLQSEGKNPSLKMLDLAADAPTREANARVIFPNIGYSQQIAALVYLATFSRTSTDMNLVNKTRVWIDGQVGGVNIPDDQQARFYDPASGYTYIARRYGLETIDGKSVDKGIAARMMDHANDLLAASYQVEMDPMGKMLRDAHGAPVLVLDPNGQPIPLDPDKSQIGNLTRYVGLLDATRQIGQQLGYGPLGGPGGDE